MPRLTLMLDTNVVVDYLNRREPFYRPARLLMICGRVGEFRLTITSSQMTDLVYILSDGGRASAMRAVLEKLRGLRTFVDVFPIDDRQIDRMLATAWNDPEDALLYEAALDCHADCLVTRNQHDFEGGLVRIMDCEELFAWLKSESGLVYEEVAARG